MIKSNTYPAAVGDRSLTSEMAKSLNARLEITPNGMLSAGRNTPFLGWEFRGRVTHTLFEGRVVFSEPNEVDQGLDIVTNKPHRDTIYPEQAEILSHQARAGDQYILRVRAPKCAANALPGSFAHIQVAASRLMRRPISIMRTSASEGWVEFLYKAVGEGTRLLATRQPGEILDMLGPIGTVFRFNRGRPRPLLIGGGVGMPPMIFAAQQLHGDKHFKPFAILGSEVPFPFNPRPSRILTPEMPTGVIASVPLLDDWGIPCRLTSQRDIAGCYQGFVTDLARHWLNTLERENLSQVEIFSCGPHPMLAAAAALASEFDLPCQVSLEEYMACAVGGCAGCVVAVKTGETSQAMKRVCVDGPVFDSRQVFF